MTTQDPTIPTESFDVVRLHAGQSPSIDKLASALCAAQGEIAAASKGATNPHFGKRYADLADVWNACRPALTKHGLSVVQVPDTDGERVVLTTTLLHTSGQWIRGVYPVRPTKQDPQAYGSALTYARRYGLAAMVGVVADDDDDGARASAPSRQQQPFYPQQQQRQVPNDVGGYDTYAAPEQDNFPPSYGEPQQAPQQQQGGPMPGPSPQNDNPTTRRLWGLILDAQSTQLIEAAVAQAMHEIGGQSPAFQELRTYAKAKFEHLASIEDSAPPDNGPNPLDVADAAE